MKEKLHWINTIPNKNIKHIIIMRLSIYRNHDKL